MHKNLLSIVLFFSLPCTVHAMKRPTNFGDAKTAGKKLKSAGGNEGISTITKDTIFELILYNTDHQTICSVAQLDKKYHQWVMGSTEMRKNLLRKRDYCINEGKNLLWHPYGSACCYAYESGSLHKKDVILASVSLVNQSNENNSVVTSSSCYDSAIVGCSKKMAIFKNCLFLLPEKSKPFFGENRQLCVYCCKTCNNAGNEPHIMRLSLDQSEEICTIKLKYATENFLGALYIYELINFIEYPFLLNAILASTKIVQDNKLAGITYLSCHVHSDLAYWASHLQFDLAGVRLPKNFFENNAKLSALLQCYPDIKSFGEFPNDIYNSIVEHYQHQNNQG